MKELLLAAVLCPWLGAGGIEEASTVEPGVDAVERVRALGGGGPEGVSLLLEILGTERVDAETPLDPEAKRAILAVFVELGREGMLASLRAVDLETCENGSRRAILEVLGQLGTADDLGLAFAAVETASARAPLLRTLQDALELIVARDKDSYARLGVHFFGLEGLLAVPIANAVARNPSQESLAFLIERLSFDRPLDAVLLSLIPKASRGLPRNFEEGLREAPRTFLWDADYQLQRQAMVAVACLGDFGSIQALIELLSSENDVVSTTSHWALRELTGLQLHLDPQGWRSWFESERRWYEEEAPRLLLQLNEAQDAGVVGAMRALSAHRYERDRTALEIAAVLGHEDSYLRKRACASLRRLGSTAPVAQLLACLESEDEVAVEAHRTLEALTGGELPRDPAHPVEAAGP